MWTAISTNQGYGRPCTGPCSCHNTRTLTRGHHRVDNHRDQRYGRECSCQKGRNLPERRPLPCGRPYKLRKSYPCSCQTASEKLTNQRSSTQCRAMQIQKENTKLLISEVSCLHTGQRPTVFCRGATHQTCLLHGERSTRSTRAASAAAGAMRLPPEGQRQSREHEPVVWRCQLWSRLQTLRRATHHTCEISGAFDALGSAQLRRQRGPCARHQKGSGRAESKSQLMGSGASRCTALCKRKRHRAASPSQARSSSGQAEAGNQS